MFDHKLRGDTVSVKIYKCPHCESESINLFNKAMLDVRYKTKCKNCGGKYGPPSYISLIDIAYAILYYLILTASFTVPIKVAFVVLILAVHFLINILFVPIVKK